MTRRLLGLTTALFALFAPSASAATICVPFGTGCDASSVSLQGAIDIANLDPAVRDTIRINAGYEVTENALVTSANLVDIVGGGQDEAGTVLRSPNAAYALDIQSPGSTVSNLRVLVETHGGGFEAGLALSAPGVTADGVTVLGGTGVNTATGVQVRTGAVLRNARVELPLANASFAVRAEEGTLIENVTAAGSAMVSVNDDGPPVVIRRLRSSYPSVAGVYARRGQIQISDALIRLSGGDGAGLAAEANTGEDPSIVARHVTVIGTGAPADAGLGVYAGTYDPVGTATVDVRDSLFHALSTDLQVDSTNGGRARVAIEHSNYDPARVSDATAGDAQVVPGAGNLLVNPGFVDAAALDFRLRPDSPLIDRGFPGAGSTADLDGQPRPNDGNGDGAAVRDIGAFEFQRPASPPLADTSAPLFRVLSKRLKLDRRGRVAVALLGPANETSISRGALGLRRARGRLVLGRKSFTLRPSARAVIKLKLSRKKARRVRKMKKMRVSLSVTVRDSAGNARTARKRVVLRPASKRR